MLAGNTPNYISSEDYSYIAKGMTDMELAQLSFTTSVVLNYPQFATYGWSYDQIMNCLGAALGINEINSLIKNTKELMNLGVNSGEIASELAWKAAKLIIRRYIGWLGVAVAIYSFGNYMNG